MDNSRNFPFVKP